MAVCGPTDDNHGVYCNDKDKTPYSWNGVEAITPSQCVKTDASGKTTNSTCPDPTATILLKRVDASHAGIQATSAQTPRTTCTMKDSDGKVVPQYGVAGPSSSDGSFSDVYAPWIGAHISGIGTDGYYTSYGDTADLQAKYGWLDGFIPNLHPAASNGDGIKPIAIGMEVLCRDPKLTCGAFYEGKIVDASLDGKWVCKLNRADIEILPFVEPIDIRPLCFAKAQDYIAADEGHWPGKHPQPKWRDARTGTGSDCKAFCEIPIEKSGTCPDFACLGENILHRGSTTAGYFIDGSISGIFLETVGGAYKYAINNQQSQVSPQWGPLPNNADSYIVPKTSTTLPSAGETGMYGQMVICETTVPATTCKATIGENPLCYELGTIFNIPTKSTDKQYHQYSCENQATMTTPTHCGTDTTKMWDICYPQQL